MKKVSKIASGAMLAMAALSAPGSSADAQWYKTTENAAGNAEEALKCSDTVQTIMLWTNNKYAYSAWSSKPAEVDAYFTLNADRPLMAVRSQVPVNIMRHPTGEWMIFVQETSYFGGTTNHCLTRGGDALTGLSVKSCDMNNVDQKWVFVRHEGVGQSADHIVAPEGYKASGKFRITSPDQALGISLAKNNKERSKYKCLVVTGEPDFQTNGIESWTKWPKASFGDCVYRNEGKDANEYSRTVFTAAQSDGSDQDLRRHLIETCDPEAHGCSAGETCVMVDGTKARCVEGEEDRACAVQGEACIADKILTEAECIKVGGHYINHVCSNLWVGGIARCKDLNGAVGYPTAPGAAPTCNIIVAPSGTGACSTSADCKMTHETCNAVGGTHFKNEPCKILWSHRSSSECKELGGTIDGQTCNFPVKEFVVNANTVTFSRP